MKVALTLAELRDWSRGAHIASFEPPLGIACLAGYAREYANVSNLEIRILRDVDALIEYGPDLVGISSFTRGYSRVEPIAKRVKEELGVPVVVGGIHISAMPTSLTEHCDVGVIGEGEVTFTELLEAYGAGRWGACDLEKIKGVVFRDGGRFVRTTPRPLIRDLDALPFPARDLFEDQWPHPFGERCQHVFSSRGCPYDCSFCCTGAALGRGTRFHSAEYMVRQIEHLRRDFDPGRIKFEDDLFTLNKDRARRMNKLLGDRGIKEGVTFNCFSRVNHLDDEWCETLKDLGFDVVALGLESMSDHLLRFLDKAGVTAERNAETVDMIHDHGLTPAANFILGVPGETREDILRLHGYIMDNIQKFNSAVVNRLTVYPGTRLWDYGTERGWSEEELLRGVMREEGEDVFLDDRDFAMSRYPYLNEERIPRREFENYFEMFSRLWLVMPQNWDRNMRLRQESAARFRLEEENRDLRTELDWRRSEPLASVLKRKLLNRLRGVGVHAMACCQQPEG